MARVFTRQTNRVNGVGGVIAFAEVVNDLQIAIEEMSQQAASVTVTLDGGGAVIVAGQIAYLKIPWPCSVNGWAMWGTASGTGTVIVYRAADATPTVFTEISGGGAERPHLTAQQYNEDTSLTGWSDTSLEGGDILRFEANGTWTTIEVAGIALDLIRAV